MADRKLDMRITFHSNILDVQRRYLTDAPTPSQFASTMKSIDAGDLAAAVELNEEMEAKDAHLQGVANIRRLSLTQAPWHIEPNRHSLDTKGAEEAARYCEDALHNVLGWEDGLRHLATAIGPGIAVVELVWNRGKVVEAIPVPGARLQADIMTSDGVYVLTDENLTEGVKAYPPKFIVYMPNMRAGAPLRVTITRAQAYLWIIKHYAIADWSAFTEVYGQPLRVAKFKEGYTPKEAEEAEKMLKRMVSDCWGLFSDKIDLQFLEAARANQPYEGMLTWIEGKQSILYLGQTLTTEPGPVGSLALGRVHESVRASLTLDDMTQEGLCIDQQVLRWLVRFRYPNTPMPVPHFAREPQETPTTDSARLTLEKLKFMQETDRPVEDDYVYEALGIPRPKNVPRETEPAPT